MNYNILFMVLVVLLSAGCTPNEDNQGYITTPGFINKNGVIIKVTSKSDLKKGELTLLMQVKNHTCKTITVDYFNCYLSVDTDNYTAPQSLASYKTKIPSWGKEYYEINYYPINSLEFYNRMSYRGDMKQKYGLLLDFIKDNEGNQLLVENIYFELQDSLYQNYLNTWGRDAKIKLFDYAFNHDSFISEQKNYCKKIVPIMSTNDVPQDTETGNIILLSNAEILIDSKVIGTQCYRQDDTLFMNIKLVNMGTNRFKVLLNKLNLSIMGANYSPAAIQSEFFSYNQVTDSTIILKQGGRFITLVKYYIPKQYDQYLLNTGWLLIQGNNAQYNKDEYIRLLYTDLAFKESDLNN